MREIIERGYEISGIVLQAIDQRRHRPHFRKIGGGRWKSVETAGFMHLLVEIYYVYVNELVRLQ